MATRLDLFLNGNPNGKTDRDRAGRQVTDKEKPFSLWSFENREKWMITDDDQDEFLKLYCAELQNRGPRFFTEKSTPIGQVRIDLDFKYKGRVDEHRHTQEQVVAFMRAFMTELKLYHVLPETVELYVLEKDHPTYSKADDISSSGIHIQIPSVKTRADVEQHLRRSLLRRMEEFFPGLGLLKPWDDVYDKQPLSHTNNWPLLGSKKNTDGALPYKIRYLLDWDRETGELSVDTQVPQIITPDLVKTLSVRSRKDEETPLTDYAKEHCRPPAEAPVTRSVSRGRQPERSQMESRGSSPGRGVYIAPLSETFKDYVEKHVKNLGEHRYNGDHNDWAAVGQCLKNIHPDLEDVFLDFMARTTVSGRESKARTAWNGFVFRVEGDRLGIGSLRTWSKTDNFEGYLEIEAGNVDRLVDDAAERETEYDFAQVIHAKYRDEFKCANFRQNEWYQYVGHIWKRTDYGVELQKRLPADIAKLFMAKEQEKGTFAQNNPCQHSLKQPDPSCETCQAISKKNMYWNAWLKLRRTGFAESVMKQCKLIFYDKEFAEKLDDNKHLIAFKNGVYDTLTQTFRPGQPEDCISFCTKIDYAMDTQYHQFKCWSELEKFLHSILPHKATRDYFLKHLATCLSGVFTQRFHILTGSGSNGKSMLMNLCATAFGEYCYKANIAMFTQKRGKAGAAAPELVRMKGKRFVFMSEPDEGEPLSTGFMKEMTSSEKVTGRDLFAGSKDIVEFDVQAKCHLACNDKPKVNTNDGGTWRRLKVIDFPMKFVAEPSAANELPMDESIMHKVLSQEWAECFMAYLVHLHKDGKGLTKLTPPKEVDAYTNEYKEESDAIARFIAEHIHPLDDSVTDPTQGYEKVSWSEIATTFKEWKRQNEVNGATVVELRKRVEVSYGKLPAGGWGGFRFGTL
jgi:P4 family phage/plasmid primase-like protien